MYLGKGGSCGMGFSVRSLWTYYLREMSGTELCIPILFLVGRQREREKINFTKKVHFSALYWKLKFLSIWHEIFAFLRERKKSNRERRRWMLLPLLNTQITSSFSQDMRNIDSVSFLCLKIFVNFLEINKSPTHQVSMLWISMSNGTVSMGWESNFSLSEKQWEIGLTELIKTSSHCIGSSSNILGEFARFIASVITI